MACNRVLLMSLCISGAACAQNYINIWLSGFFTCVVFCCVFFLAVFNFFFTSLLSFHSSSLLPFYFSARRATRHPPDCSAYFGQGASSKICEVKKIKWRDREPVCCSIPRWRVMEKTTGLKITSPNVVVITSPYLLPLLLLLLFLLHVFVFRTSGDHPFCENALWDRIKTGRIKNNRKKDGERRTLITIIVVAVESVCVRKKGEKTTEDTNVHRKEIVLVPFFASLPLKPIWLVAKRVYISRTIIIARFQSYIHTFETNPLTVEIITIIMTTITVSSTSNTGFNIGFFGISPEFSQKSMCYTRRHTDL